MIGLMQKMFGQNFWENVILEATHWNYHEKSIQMRRSSNPPILETWWTNQFNKLFAREYGVKFKLPSVFIDTYYDKDNPYELKQFRQQTNKLFEFATNRNPFECKDIGKRKRNVFSNHQIGQFLKISSNGNKDF